MNSDLTASMEDYLEAIYDIQLARKVVRVTDIARQMNVRTPSVTGALKALQDRGLVDHERYGYVELTPEGRRIGEEMQRRHAALVAFLGDILGLEADQAKEEACQLEHSVSAETLHRLLCLLEFIEKCPRGGHDWLGHLRGRWTQVSCDHDCQECISQIEIPEGGPFAEEDDDVAVETLNQFGPGFRGTVTKVAGSGDIRRRIVEMGVTVGADIEVRRIAPLGDPIEVIVRGYHLSLRKQEAANIHVRPEGQVIAPGRDRPRTGDRRRQARRGRRNRPKAPRR